MINIRSYLDKMFIHNLSGVMISRYLTSSNLELWTFDLVNNLFARFLVSAFAPRLQMLEIWDKLHKDIFERYPWAVSLFTECLDSSPSSSIIFHKINPHYQKYSFNLISSLWLRSIYLKHPIYRIILINLWNSNIGHPSLYYVFLYFCKVQLVF